MVALENQENIPFEADNMNNENNEKMAFTGFVLSLIGAILMCFSVIPLYGILIFFIAAGFIVVSENMLNKYKSITNVQSKYFKIGKIVTVVGASISVITITVCVLLTIL